MAFEDLVGPPPSPDEDFEAMIKREALRLGVDPQEVLNRIAGHIDPNQPDVPNSRTRPDGSPLTRVPIYPRDLNEDASVKPGNLFGENAGGQGGMLPPAVGIDADTLYKTVIEKQDEPGLLAQAVVRPPAPAPVPVQPAAAPVPESDPTEQLKALLTPEPKPVDDGPPAVTNQNQGLTGQLENAPAPVLSAPSPPISQPSESDNALIAKYGQPAPAPPKQSPGILGESLAQLRQAGSGALGNATAMPLNAAAALTALVAIPTRKLGIEGPASAVQSLQGEARRMQEGADFATGASSTPRTPGQNLARIVGRNANPSGLMTAAMTGADLLSQAITPTPVAAAAPLDKPMAEKLLFPNRVNTGPGPRVTHTIKTAGGPAQVSDGDLKLMGIIGAVTIGAIFAPSVIARISKTPLPIFRDVENAAPGTKAISNRIDLGRTYDDVNAGIFRVARRAGIDPLTLANVQDTFRIQTGGAARNLVNSAVVNGEMQTPNFVFKTKVPVSELARKDSPEFRDYLHARDTFDDITRKEEIIQNKGKKAIAQQAAIGPIQVRGMTKQDAINTVNALEAANPELRALGSAYRNNVKEMRRFNATGEYSTMSAKKLQEANQKNSNFVPWRDSTGKKRVIEEDVDRLSPFDALKEEMQITMRLRMENEAKGLYIDGMRKVEPDLFKRITPKELTDNPHWQQNTVSFERRGKREYYTTDPFLADVLNHDPYAVSGQIAQGLYATKRLMESTATGVLAPWFAPTSALRSWQIGKITTPKPYISPNTGEAIPYKSPTLLGMTKAIPQQIYPQLAKAISTSLENGSGGWLNSVFGTQTTQALSMKLAKAYDNSLYAQLERVGTHQGSFLQHQQQFNAILDKLASTATGTSKTFLVGYKQFLNAIHNSPSFDFASKNYGNVPLPKLAMEARHLTGDPLVAGQFTVDGRKPIRMDKPLLGSDVAGKAATIATQAYGFTTGIGREAIPWWNITTQGMKRIGESYVENPAKFVGKAYLYQMVPAASLYMYSRGAGLDPSGKSYSDYQMNGRSEYAKLMNWYIPIPGRPAEDGIEIPRFHELAPAAHMMEVALDHMVRSQTFEAGEDFMRTALSLIGAKDTFPKDNGGAIFNPGEDAGQVGKTFMEAAVVPPTPPLISAAMGTQGFVSPQGLFGGGDAYRKKQDPYDQLGGLNAQTELTIRALGTGLADILGSGYAAYTQTPEGVLAGLKNAMTEGGKRAIMKTPIARDMFDIKPPQTGNTRITEELFKKEKVINNLSKFYRTWTAADGKINTKMASERGGQVVQDLLGSGPPEESAGLHQPLPTNPLYLSFMDEVYNKFNKDSPDKKVNPVTGNKSSSKDAVWVPDENGGIGVKSLWRRYGDYSTNLKRLRQINDGNAVTWQMQLAQRPEQLKYLKDNNIDYKNPRSVRNFYENKRQEVARQILFTIRAVEEDFSKRLVQPFHIEDLDPYAKGGPILPEGSVIEQPTTIAPWNDGTGVNN